jgi:hypothetical protein
LLGRFFNSSRAGSRGDPYYRVIAYAAKNPSALPLLPVPPAKILRRVEKVSLAGRYFHNYRQVISGQLLSSDVNPAKALIVQELQKL